MCTTYYWTLAAHLICKKLNAAQYNQQIARYRESLDILNQRISEAGTKSAQLRGAAGRTGGADAAALRASAGEIDAMFDDFYHLKHVDALFERVFGPEL